MKIKWFLILAIVWISAVGEAVLFMDYIARRKTGLSCQGLSTKHEVADTSFNLNLPLTPANVKKVCDRIVPKNSVFQPFTERQIRNILADAECSSTDTLFLYISPCQYSQLSVASYERTYTIRYRAPHLWQIHYRKQTSLDEIPASIVNQTIEYPEYANHKENTFLSLRIAIRNDTIRTVTAHLEQI